MGLEGAANGQMEENGQEEEAARQETVYLSFEAPPLSAEEGKGEEGPALVEGATGSNVASKTHLQAQEVAPAMEESPEVATTGETNPEGKQSSLDD